MITPIRTMTIEQICERKDDLLICSDDVKDLARNERNKAIDEFAEAFIYKAICSGCSTCCNCYENGHQRYCEDYKQYMEIAEQMKGV
jgi:hypothetical protein